MTKWLTIRNEQEGLTVLMLAFALTLPVSISISQGLAYFALPVWGYALFKKRAPRPVDHALFWPTVLFALLLLCGALFGPNTQDSLFKSRRLLLLMLIFILPLVFRGDNDDPRRSLVMPMLFFAIGSSVQGIWDMIRVPHEISQGVSLYDTGNMRDPQLYMVGAIFMLAFWIYRPLRIPQWVVGVLITINMLGMVLHFKRGVWISFLLTAVLVSGLTRRYKIVLAVVLSVVSLLLIPQTRERLELLQEELRVQTGGRWVLWTQVAPDMMRDYPLGTGLRGLEHEDFLRYSPHLQPGLNHLHNNFLQIAVDAGWAGLAVWVVWMGMAFVIMARLSRRYHRQDPIRAALGLGCMAAFVGLIFNGVVEYNFGNSVMFMTFVFLLGLTNALSQSSHPPVTRPEAEPTGSPLP